MLVGYDTRLASEDFADAVAEVSTANDVVTFLCDKASTTPAVAYNVVARDAGAGVVITASHNPACWNGFKYKPDYGGSASSEIVEFRQFFINDKEECDFVFRKALELFTFGQKIKINLKF